MLRNFIICFRAPPSGSTPTPPPVPGSPAPGSTSGGAGGATEASGDYRVSANILKCWHKILLQVAVFGAGGVGKSSIGRKVFCDSKKLFHKFILVLRFIKNTFSESYVPTVEDTYTQVGIFLL